MAPRSTARPERDGVRVAVSARVLLPRRAPPWHAALPLRGVRAIRLPRADLARARPHGHHALFAACGHAYVARPVHSPDFGFIEWSFNWIRTYLQSNAHHINTLNLQAWIDTACAAITPGLVQGFAVDAHYYVPGRNYRPYVY